MECASGALFNKYPNVLQALWPETQHGRWMDLNYEPGLVSVIVPTYNRSQFLIEALNSVRAQTYRPIELLVVDDGSTDETERLVRQWADRRATGGDQLAMHYLRQQNSGAPAARNLGLIESKGEFIQYLDSDDVLHPQKLSIHVGAFDSNHDFVWSDHDAFDADKGEPAFDSYDEENLHEQAERIPNAEPFGTVGNVWTGLYRRSGCVAAGPWNENLIRWQDLDYNMRFTCLRPSCMFVDATLVSMGNHTSGRIQGLPDTKKVQGGLRSLNSMERTLAYHGVPEGIKARDAMANFYLGIMRLAMKLELKKEVRKALRGARRNRRDTTFQLKLGILDWISRIMGMQAGYRALCAYTNWQMARAE